MLLVTLELQGCNDNNWSDDQWNDFNGILAKAIFNCHSHTNKAVF